MVAIVQWVCSPLLQKVTFIFGNWYIPISLTHDGGINITSDLPRMNSNDWCSLYISIFPFVMNSFKHVHVLYLPRQFFIRCNLKVFQMNAKSIISNQEKDEKIVAKAINTGSLCSSCVKFSTARQ
jgi:hypothetical protein